MSLSLKKKAFKSLKSVLSFVMKVQYIFNGFSFCSAEIFRVIHAKG